MSLVEDALGGDRYALARLISLVEDGGPDGREALSVLYPRTGAAHIVGVTGAPGTGKSTLVNALARVLRERGITVGVISVDPTSPFSGGALLGDRIRMRDLAGDPGVFVRSMATRGSEGGLARATGDAVKVLDAAGFGVILVETVGAGQSELAISRAAHTVIVVEAPGMGDEIQALKAGLLEIADVLVVNKADRPGAELAARALGLTVGQSAGATEGAWHTPVLLTVATDGTGVAGLVDAIRGHGEYLRERGLLVAQERARARAELVDQLQWEFLTQVRGRLGEDGLEAWANRIAAREVDAHTAAMAILGQAGLGAVGDERGPDLGEEGGDVRG